MTNLEGKNCLITGATGALGSELARQLNAKGCNLFLTGTNQNKLDELVKELRATDNGWIRSQVSNLSRTKLISHFVHEVDSEYDIDILINSAGVFSIEEIGDVSENKLEATMNVNVNVPYLLCKHFSKGMKERKWGKIINVGSSSSYAGFKGGSLYCMTKHAILGMSRSLQEELKEYNVQVSCVSPGSMKSEMAKISVDQDFETFLEPKDVAEQVVNVLSMENNMVCKELRLDRETVR